MASKVVRQRPPASLMQPEHGGFLGFRHHYAFRASHTLTMCYTRGRFTLGGTTLGLSSHWKLMRTLRQTESGSDSMGTGPTP